MGSGKPLGHPFHHALQRDQVVIDLHWAHATQQEGIEVCPGFERYGDLLDPKQDFCFDIAWELAAKNLTNDFRVLGVFVISDFLQFQMAKLRSQQTRAKVLSYSKRRSMPDGTRQPAVDKLLAQQLMDWLRRDSRIKNEVSCYKGIVRARFLLGSTCTNKMLAKLAALLAGVPERAPKTIAEKLQKLQAHTDPSMWV